jgi:hypothetical protein
VIFDGVEQEMLAQMQGVIDGKHIELECETGLPVGTTVIVRIQRKSLTLQEKRRWVDRLCGAWADDPSLKPIFAEIERQRALTMPREVNFHAAS